MSKYIDADELLKKLPDDLSYKASVKRVLMQAPTVDVAPIADTVRKVKEHIVKSLSTTTTVGVGFLETLLEDIEEEIIGGTDDKKD